MHRFMPDWAEYTVNMSLGNHKPWKELHFIVEEYNLSVTLYETTTCKANGILLSLLHITMNLEIGNVYYGDCVQAIKI